MESRYNLLLLLKVCVWFSSLSPWLHSQQKKGEERESKRNKCLNKERARLEKVKAEWQREERIRGGLALWEIVGTLSVCVCEGEREISWASEIHVSVSLVAVESVYPQFEKLIYFSASVCGWETGTEDGFTAIIKAVTSTGQDWIGR